MKKRILLLLGMLFPLAASAKTYFSHTDIFLMMIKQELGNSCSVELVGETGLVYGNNGLYMGTMSVNTCAGSKRYTVEYLPKSAFPDRDFPYRVTEITAESAPSQSAASGA